MLVLSTLVPLWVSISLALLLHMCSLSTKLPMGSHQMPCKRPLPAVTLPHCGDIPSPFGRGWG